MNQEKIFTCEKKGCEKIFKYESHYKRHMETHENKKYECQQCHKKFKRQDALSVHERSHNNELIYKCSQEGCDKKFSTKASLRYHTLKHKNQVEFVCKLENCNKKFLTIAQLHQHLKTKGHNNGSNLNSKKHKKQQEQLIEEEKNLNNQIKQHQQKYKNQPENVEILEGNDIYQFDEKQMQIINDVYQKKQYFPALLQQYQETQYGKFKLELSTVVGVANQIQQKEQDNDKILNTALSYVLPNKENSQIQCDDLQNQEQYNFNDDYNQYNNNDYNYYSDANQYSYGLNTSDHIMSQQTPTTLDLNNYNNNNNNNNIQENQNNMDILNNSNNYNKSDINFEITDPNNTMDQISQNNDFQNIQLNQEQAKNNQCNFFLDYNQANSENHDKQQINKSDQLFEIQSNFDNNNISNMDNSFTFKDIDIQQQNNNEQIIQQDSVSNKQPIIDFLL